MRQVIVQVVQHLAPGGIECMVLDLLQHATAEQQVYVVSLEGTAAQLQQWPRLQPYSERLLFLDKQSGWQPRLVWRLRQLLVSLQADVVHTHHIGPLLYGGLAARLAGVTRRLHTEHDAWHLHSRKRRWLANQALRWVQPLLVVDSQLVSHTLRQLLPGHNPLVVLNGVDAQRFTPGPKTIARQHLGLPETVRLIGCAARLQEVKGHTTLLDALLRLPVDVHLALAGSGPLLAQLQQQTADLGLLQRVHFLGHVEAMVDFYRALDVFCLASFAEGMPLSLLEAQACGVPVVATQVGGVAEAVCPQTGMLLPAGRPLALAGALRAQLNRHQEQSPRQFVLRGKTVAHMVKAYAQLGQGVQHAR